MTARKSVLKRVTKETSVSCFLDLDGQGAGKIETKIGFFDHMLELFVFHSGFDCNVQAEGDLHVDEHHLIEDVGICLGQAFEQALQEKRGIQRYATVYLPMDEVLSRTVCDLSGRFFHYFAASFTQDKLGQFPCEMTSHFFYSFALQAKMNLHQEILYGANDHHKIEALFKGFAQTLKQACKVSGNQIPSTKGSLSV